MWSWMSCEKFAEDSSKERDCKLCLYEKIRNVFHYCICFSCRRFKKQISFLDCMCSKYADDIGCPDQELSQEAKDRITSKLSSEL